MELSKVVFLLESVRVTTSVVTFFSRLGILKAEEATEVRDMFGEKVRNLRELHHLTQEELAKKLHVSRNAVSKWETGKGYPSLDSLKLLATLFDVSIDELISEEERSAKKKIEIDRWSNWVLIIAYFIYLLLMLICFTLMDTQGTLTEAEWQQEFENRALVRRIAESVQNVGTVAFVGCHIGFIVKSLMEGAGRVYKQVFLSYGRTAVFLCGGFAVATIIDSGNFGDYLYPLWNIGAWMIVFLCMEIIVNFAQRKRKE